ncbi:MAG: acyltransferase [Candidatus Roizmanbacteria bacterium]|nr:acyltransferase [Candidatus Roizmanbacteria bacterium]
MKTTKKYSINADIVRILAGFGVVLIHVSDPFIGYPPTMGTRGFSWELVHLVNTFFRTSVPLFIMLSGYLLLDPAKSFDPKTFYRKRLWRVGIPFIFWVLVDLTWTYVNAEKVPTPFELFEKVLGVNLGHLYFLVIILELYYLTPYLLAFIKNTSRKMHTYLLYNAFGFTLLLSGINALSDKASVITSDNIITIFLPFVGYYVAGYYFKDTIVKYATSFWTVAAYFILTFITAMASNGDVGAYPRQYGSPFIMAMTLISFLYLMRSTLIASLANNTVVLFSVKFLASMIFGIYLTHMLVLNLFDYWYGITPESVPSPMWQFVLLKIAVVFTVCLIIVSIGKRIPYVRSIFGS